MKLSVAAVCLILVGVSECAKILAFFPFPARSHQRTFTPIIRELVKRGHHVTFYTPFTLPDPPPHNYTEVLLPDVFSKIIHENIDLVAMGQVNPVEQSRIIFDYGYLVQERSCQLEPVRRLIESEEAHFDAILLEVFFVQESYVALQHKFGAVAIQIQTLGSFYWTHELAGALYNPAYMLDFKLDLTNSMNFLERLKNVFAVYGTSILGYFYHIPRVERLMESCYRYPGWETRPPLSELLANQSLVVQNSHFSLNYPEPLSPHFIDVAGINIQPNKPLPKDIQDFMDEAQHGVIYFSLGSNLRVSELAKDNVFQAFYSVFSKLRQNVLWKWENKNFPVKSDKIKISEWFPQQDILAHKNCVLFISHGGFLSTNEAVYYGVPLIGIPFFGDQPKNVRHIVEGGYGIRLDPDNITEASVSWAVHEILSNPFYKVNMRTRSEIFKDRPMSAIDSAIYWIEYVIRNRGAPHLRPALAKLPWYKAMLVDVAAVLVSVALGVCALLYLVIKFFFRLVCRKGVDKRGKLIKEKNK